MDDRQLKERVIRGLELCAGNSTCNWRKCPYNPKHIDHPNYPACRIELENDALALLKAMTPKAQEPLAVRETELNQCVCGNKINRYWHPEFCGFCGKKLEWY